MDMTRARRIGAVTAGLALTGVVAGAVLGGIILTAVVLAGDSHPTAASVLFLFPVGAIFGASVGAVLAPIATWTLLRRIPLGRAIAEAAIGTVLGAAVGAPIPFVGPILGGIGGFVLGVLRLRVFIQPRLTQGQQGCVSQGRVRVRAESAEGDW